jgi:hypothetical protein
MTTNTWTTGRGQTRLLVDGESLGGILTMYELPVVKQHLLYTRRLLAKRWRDDAWTVAMGTAEVTLCKQCLVPAACVRSVLEALRGPGSAPRVEIYMCHDVLRCKHVFTRYIDAESAIAAFEDPQERHGKMTYLRVAVTDADARLVIPGIPGVRRTTAAEAIITADSIVAEAKRWHRDRMNVGVHRIVSIMHNVISRAPDP